MDLWSKQKEILDAIFSKPKVAVRACHSVGKTFVASVAVLAFLYLRTPCKVITTAPTFYQVKDLLWSEINMLFKTRLEPLGFPGEVFTTRLKIMDNWFAVGLSPRESINFQGFHSPNILIVYDESPGVRNDIVEGAEGLLSSGDTHVLHIGNPVKSSGHFYSMFSGKDSKDYHPVHVSAFMTPNFTGEKVPHFVRENLVKRKWVEDVGRKWGIRSPLYKSRVLGDFPDESENQLIPLSLCEEAVYREINNPSDSPRQLGVDIARFGDDETVYTIRNGLLVEKVINEQNRDTMEIVGRICRLMDEYEIDMVKVDSIGIGAGVEDRLRELGRNVVGVNSSKSAQDPRYYNKRTELWFGGRNWLTRGKIPDNTDLIADLTTPLFSYTSKGQYKVESKEEIKKRLGRSTDFADSFNLSVDETTSLNSDIFASSKRYDIGAMLDEEKIFFDDDQ